MFVRTSLQFAGVATGANLLYRYLDGVDGKDSFAQHTNAQHKSARFLTGMHEPFMPTEEQKEFVAKNFPQYRRLLPESKDEFLSRRSIKTPVRIHPLTDEMKMMNSTAIRTAAIKELYDISHRDQVAIRTVVVGGPPALLSSATDQNITYVNDTRQVPIADGSAWHLEWDSPSEAPTIFQPHVFMYQQIKRAIIPETLRETEKSGLFSWRSLDWVSWILHPESWLEGVSLAYHFQMETMMDEASRARVNNDCAQRCKANEKYFFHLNDLVGGKLFLPVPNGKGSVIVARTEGEVGDMKALKTALERESRVFELLDPSITKRRFGLPFENALMIGEKCHDMIINPNFMTILSSYLQNKGNKVIDGVLVDIYTDDPSLGGYVKVVANKGGETLLIPFDRLVLSLGTQKVTDKNGKALLDIVAARGVSCIAMAYLPKGSKLPQATVCGATNHVTALAGPIPIMRGKDPSECYLVKLTCSACITPNVIDRTCADYDSIAATGLISAVRQTLACEIEPLTVWGCNRQVSRWGQSHWLDVKMDNGNIQLIDKGTHLSRSSCGIHVQLGAGGGGLTIGPSQPPL